MAEWTREARYQRIEDVDTETFMELKTSRCFSIRQTYHIQPETGLLNDPNGLIYYDGLLHITSVVPIRSSTWT